MGFPDTQRVEAIREQGELRRQQKREKIEAELECVQAPDLCLSVAKGDAQTRR